MSECQEFICGISNSTKVRQSHSKIGHWTAARRDVSPTSHHTYPDSSYGGTLPRIAGILLRRPANYSVRQKPPHIPRLRCIRAGLVRSRRHAIRPPTSTHHIHGPHQPGLLHAASRVTCPQISGRGLSSPEHRPVHLSAVRLILAADTDTGPS